MAENKKDNSVKKNYSILDKINEHASWIVVIAGIGIRFIINTLEANLTIQDIITDYILWIDILFTITINLIVVSNAIDKSVIDGLESYQFKAADEKNNIIIEDVRNNLDQFITFIKLWNANELRITQEGFLATCGVSDYSDLDDSQKEKFNNLVSNRYNVEGFTLPLYTQTMEGKEYRFDANFNEDKYKKRGYVTKTLFGVMGGAVKIGGSFMFSNINEALTQTIIFILVLAISYFNYYRTPRKEMLFILPQKVKQKESVYRSFKKWQAGELKLKERLKVEKDNENDINI